MIVPRNLSVEGEVEVKESNATVAMYEEVHEDEDAPMVVAEEEKVEVEEVEERNENQGAKKVAGASMIAEPLASKYFKKLFAVCVYSVHTYTIQQVLMAPLSYRTKLGQHQTRLVSTPLLLLRRPALSSLPSYSSRLKSLRRPRKRKSVNLAHPRRPLPMVLRLKRRKSEPSQVLLVLRKERRTARAQVV